MRRALLLLLLLSACAAPREQVVLLDASPGEALTVTSQQQTAVLTVPRSALALGAEGQMAQMVLSAEVIQARYGAVLGLLPAPGRLWTLRFDTGAVELTSESQAEVPALLAAIAERAAVEVLIEGHTDQAGEDADNDALALARAEAVRALLVAQGLQATFVRVTGRGARAPLVDAPGQDQPQNRRVEVLVR